MRCDAVQRVISDRLDGPVPENTATAADDHVAGCPECADFEVQLEARRRQLRVGTVERPPDIAGAVRARLQAQTPVRDRAERRGDWGRAAAVFLVAFAMGAAAIGLRGPRQVGAVELSQLVHAGQHRVQSLHAQVTVEEYGWHPDVPDRTHVGTIVYDAPESLALQLRDQTVYPTDDWRPNDVTVVVDDTTAWSRARTGCPMAALPECQPASPRTTVVTGREPYDPAEPVPLDLVVPVASFGTATTASDAVAVTVDGRRAVEVAIPVAQLQPMLDGILAVGAWRKLHPGDLATVALDTQYGVPLRVEVTAGSGTMREQWAATLGYDDRPGEVLWSWMLTGVTVNVPAPEPMPSPPRDRDGTVDRGFQTTTGATDATGILADLPVAGLSLHRLGAVGDVEVASWSDGRAWLRIRVHPDWQRPHLFGRRGGELVQRVVLPAGGVAYVAESGTEVFLHGDEVDIAITGSVTPERLREVADQIEVQGQAVPRSWAEASATTLAQARQALPGALVPPDLPAFAGPGVRVADGVVTLSYAGNGDRGFVLTQAAGEALTPPLDDVVFGVPVRGTNGRFTPGTGTLEWIEQGRTVTLRSATLPLPELLGLADRLEPS